MKEKYFDIDTIDSVTDVIYDYVHRIIKNKNRVFNYSNSALIVLDMQNYFLKEVSHAFAPSAKYIVDNINNLISFFGEKKLPVIFTKHINNNENAGMMKVWWKDMITIKNDLHAISNDLNTQYQHITIEKTQYDAFYNTNLEVFLKKNGISSLIVTGVLTHLCCETTIRSAFVRNFEVFFPVDATADYNLEFHKSSFLNLSHGFSTPLRTSDIIIERDNK